MDHRLFLVILRDTLHQGANHVVASIPRRQAWRNTNGHHLYASLLVTYFAYMDGMLGSKWIEKFGRRQKRELYVLRTARNALTHYNGKLSLLRKPKKSSPGRPKNPAGFVRRFANDLNNSRVLDDKGTPVPCYMRVKNGKVYLNSKVAGRTCKLFTTLLVRAGKIQ